MASMDSHGSCGADQAAPVSALLTSHPRPPWLPSFRLSNSPPLLIWQWLSWISHNLDPPSPKNSYSSLMFSLPVWGVECSPSESFTPHSPSELERVGQVKAVHLHYSEAEVEGLPMCPPLHHMKKLGPCLHWILPFSQPHASAQQSSLQTWVPNLPLIEKSTL